MNVARIPPERIVLLGQSLGTAITTAVAEHFALNLGIDFAGVVLVAGFSDIPTLMLTYSVGNFIPILSPLRPYPRLQQYFGSRIKDTWHTAKRLANWVRNSKQCNLVLIHAKNDFDIPWKHSDKLFEAAANATSQEGMSAQQIDSVKKHSGCGTAGYRNDWKAATVDGRTKRITQHVLNHGGEFGGPYSSILANTVKVTIALSHMLLLRRPSTSCCLSDITMSITVLHVILLFVGFLSRDVVTIGGLYV